MRILLPCLLLPHTGADHASAFTVYHTIRHLARRHEITLVSFVRDHAEAVKAEELKSLCRRVETVELPRGFRQRIKSRLCWFRQTPLAFAQCDSERMRALLHHLCREDKFDLAHVEYSPMACYANALGSLPALISVHDLVHLTAQRHARHLPLSRQKFEWWLDSRFCRDYELKFYRRFKRVVAISPSIQRQLHQMDPNLPVEVIPPGVNFPVGGKEHHPGKGHNLIFMGAMWRRENIEAVTYFCREIFPLVQSAIPDVHLLVVGGSPASAVLSLRSDAVEITGYIPDLKKCYLEADVSIAPVRVAGGVLCKILDAMAWGLPVVSTSAGNEGIGARPGQEILLGDSPEAFARQTILLLQDGNLRRSAGESARRFVENNFQWEKNIQKLEVVYAACLEHDLSPVIAD